MKIGGRTFSKSLLALLALLLCATAALAASKIAVHGFAAGAQDPATLNAGLKPADLGWHPDDSGSYGESWSIQASNAAGDFVLALLSISNYHPLHKFAGTVDLFYVPADGETYTTHGEFADDDSHAARQGIKVDIGGNTLAGEHPHYKLHAAKDNLACDLAFNVLTPPLRLGQGYIRFGEGDKRSWNLTVLGPRATVSGTVTLNGKKMPFNGLAYLDHGWSTEKLYRFSSRWYVVRILQDDFSLNAMQMRFKDDYSPEQAQAMFITLGDKVIANSGRFELDPHGSRLHQPSGLSLPESIELEYEQAGVDLEGSVAVPQKVYALNVLEQLSPVVRKLIQTLVTDPWQFRYAGVADMTLEYNGQTRRISGPAIGEVHSYK